MSLSRFFFLRYHVIDSFVDDVRRALQECEPFQVSVRGADLLCSDASGRTFLCLMVDDPWHSQKVKALIRRVDSVLVPYGQLPYYEVRTQLCGLCGCAGVDVMCMHPSALCLQNPRPHVSIAWAPGLLEWKACSSNLGSEGGSGAGREAEAGVGAGVKEGSADALQQLMSAYGSSDSEGEDEGDGGVACVNVDSAASAPHTTASIRCGCSQAGGGNVGRSSSSLVAKDSGAAVAAVAAGAEGKRRGKVFGLDGGVVEGERGEHVHLAGKGRRKRAVGECDSECSWKGDGVEGTSFGDSLEESSDSEDDAGAVSWMVHSVCIVVGNKHFSIPLVKSHAR
jgi:hypothetical protein